MKIYKKKKKTKVVRSVGLILKRKPRIIITIEGGVVQNVERVNCDALVEIHDYDVDGLDEDTLTEDSDGNKYYLYNS